MRYLIPLFLLCLSTVANSETLATINKKTITLKGFNKRYSVIKSQTINPPAPRVFLEDLLRYEVGLQEAAKMKLQNDPSVRQKINEAIYRGFVEKSIGSTVQKIKVTEDEMKKYYQKNPEVRTSHILIEFAPGSSKKEIQAAKKRATEIYTKVKKSKHPFEDLVKLYSDDALSKTTGGDIGYQTRVTLVPTYYNTVIKMKKGQIKGLVRTRYGFHIVKHTGTRPYAEANKRQLRAAVFDTKRKDVFDKFFTDLKKKYKININKNTLKKIK